jgi:hypothetical protein
MDPAVATETTDVEKQLVNEQMTAAHTSTTAAVYRWFQNAIAGQPLGAHQPPHEEGADRSLSALWRVMP